jgi:hypothetical protein
MLLSHYAVDLGALFQKHYPPPKQYQTLAEPQIQVLYRSWKWNSAKRKWKWGEENGTFRDAKKRGGS